MEKTLVDFARSFYDSNVNDFEIFRLSGHVVAVKCSKDFRLFDPFARVDVAWFGYTRLVHLPYLLSFASTSIETYAKLTDLHGEKMSDYDSIHHELPQQIFYVIVEVNTLFTAAKEYLLLFDVL